MDWLYSVGLKLLYPTAAAAVVLGLALVFVRKAFFSRACLGLGLGILLVCGNGWVVQGMVRWLEGKYRTPDAAVSADCIVVLGGGTVPGIPPRSMVEVSEAGDRVLYAARLFRNGKAPLVLCTSGVAAGGLALRPPSEDMAELVEFFGVPRASILLETASGNTREHARNLAPVFRERKFNRILLVTSAMHMPRSMGVFRKYCPEVEFIAAPTDYRAAERLPGPWYRELTGLIPTPSHFVGFSEAAHEYLGIAYYRLRGWM